ncbi:MAG: hypothetical protein KGJ02_07620 [Verrucomicrobiota bacterium]|nr:hypothetical protein [Verrucomicrobiota bacterium]
MEEKIEARVSPAKVWEAWERAHAQHGQSGIVNGQKGVSGASQSKLRYEVVDVIPGQQFSVIWKTLFVRLVFSHTVKPTPRGSEIRYSVQIKGPFSWPVRWLLGNKIRRNIGSVLRAIVKQLEAA